MKKNLIILVALLAMTCFAGSAFAAIEVTDDSTTMIAGAPFVPSTGVTLKAIATTTAYAAQSKHLSGNRCYGTRSVDSDITSVTTGCDVGTVINDPQDASTLALAATAPTP